MRTAAIPFGLAVLVLGGSVATHASAAHAPTQALAPPPRDGLITGRVVDAATGRPVSGVVVSLTGDVGPQPDRR